MVLSPFDPSADEEFKRWRDIKLENYPSSLNGILVEINDPSSLLPSEKEKILQIVAKTNNVIYTAQKKDISTNDILALGRQLGLVHVDKNPLSGNDAISVITDKSESNEPKAGEYIPYTNKAIQWHTDGYYNPPEEQIHGFILHCSENASSGGENEILDNEILYLLLREKNLEYVVTLMEEDSFVIPPNEDKEITLRPESIGPVFSYSAHFGLHTRYTARKRNIHWKDAEATRMALSELEKILNSKTSYHFSGKLEKNQGLLTNNSLHKRNSFLDTEQKKRVMFRGRFYDRIGAVD